MKVSEQLIGVYDVFISAPSTVFTAKDVEKIADVKATTVRHALLKLSKGAVLERVVSFEGYLYNLSPQYRLSILGQAIEVVKLAKRERVVK